MTTYSPVENELRRFLLDGPVHESTPSNLVETWGHYHLQLALPGVDLSEVEIEIVARTVTVAGAFRLPAVESGDAVWQQIPNGTFRYSFDLPGSVDADNAEATFDRGILTLRMPKVAYLRPSHVPIDVIQTVR
jgi:HSP20 family protein